MPYSTNAADFASNLSRVCRQHGIALAGNITLYLMDPEDFAFAYEVLPDDTLRLSAPLGDSYGNSRSGAGRDAQCGLDTNASA
jgi:hypothetical protein